MAKKVTLYIEDTEIKLLITNGRQVEKWASLLLEPTLVRDGIIIDEEKVAEEIRNMFKLQEVSSKKVEVGLSGLNSFFRIVSLPELKPSMIPEAVMSEAERVLPVPLDQIYISYQQIPSTDEETRIFIVAYPKNSTDALLRTLVAAGLKPQRMELATLALCRCSNAPKAVIINSWLTYLDIIVMSEGVPQVIRSLSLPVDTTDVTEKLVDITEELNRTIAFYNSSYPDTKLDSSVPIYVCGDLAEATDSWEMLSGTIGYQVSNLQPLLEFPEGFSPWMFMVNIGLALKGQLPKGEDDYYSIVDIDALSGIYKPSGFNLVRVLVPVMIIVALGAVAWGTYIIVGEYQKTDNLRADLSQQELQIDLKQAQIEASRADKTELQAQVDTVISDNDALNIEIAEWNDKIALQQETNQQPIEAEITANSLDTMLDGMTHGLEIIDDYLAEVVILLPDGVSLVGVNYGDNGMNLSGFAPTEGDIFTYAKELRSSSYFNMVIISSINQTGDTNTSYEFSFIIA